VYGRARPGRLGKRHDNADLCGPALATCPSHHSASPDRYWRQSLRAACRVRCFCAWSNLLTAVRATGPVSGHMSPRSARGCGCCGGTYLLDNEVANRGLHQYFFNSSRDDTAEALEGLALLAASEHAIVQREAIDAVLIQVRDGLGFDDPAGVNGTPW
jgi:hypothetical protein